MAQRLQIARYRSAAQGGFDYKEKIEVANETQFLDLAGWAGKVFNGEWVHPTGGSVQVVEPATGKVMATVGFGNAVDVNAAAKAAARAQKEWVRMPVRDRAAILRRAGDILMANLDELGMWVTRETGAIIPKGQLEIREAATYLYIAAGRVLEPIGHILPADGKQSYAVRVPHGVVGVISPFNFPLILSMRAVAPALGFGNGVVLKPDPQTPVSGGFIVARALELAGLPKGLLQVLPGGAEAGEAICNAPEIGMVCFTGSTAVGKRVGELTGKNLKRCSLELGGKSSLIVLEDADIGLAASNIAFGAFLHQGQICMASGRILVHEKIAPQVIAALAEKARHLPVGDPATGQVALGPLINARQVEKVQGIVTDSVAAGAKLEAGGSYEKLFYKPTVLSNVKPGMRAFEEEMFGPVAAITTFKSDDEAVELANQTVYGLSGGIITPNLARAWGICERVESGLFHINDQTVADECVNPFGGRGCSGNGGNIGGPNSAEQFTQLRWVTVKTAPNQYPF
ncbi:MAG: benzaldehyde dehydrogenase [Rhodocyclales bacterium]|nr:benzaldehyde dehydrogenase [Rhodocyclales bacterium]